MVDGAVRVAHSTTCRLAMLLQLLPRTRHVATKQMWVSRPSSIGERWKKGFGKFSATLAW